MPRYPHTPLREKNKMKKKKLPETDALPYAGISRKATAVSGSDSAIPGQWIDDLRQGDYDAFNRIFFAFYKPVLNFLHSLTQSRDDAEEICQEVFAKVWLNREKLDAGKNFRAYLYTITRNEAYDYFKKRKIVDAGSYQEWQSSAANDTDEVIIAKETELLINLTVSRMPKQRKRIFELSRYEGMTNEEIAKKLNIGKNAVEKQITYALKDIREVLTALIVLLLIR